MSEVNSGATASMGTGSQVKVTPRDPQIGDPVIVLGYMANGHNDQPGIVTKFWQRNVDSFAVVNVKIFPDTAPVEDRGSMYFSDTREEAEKFLAEYPTNMICIPKP